MTIQPGQKVRVPAGTPFKTTHPSRKAPTTKRTQVVTVDHLLSAWRQILAHTTVYDDGTRKTWFEGSERDQDALCERFGLPHRTEAETQASLNVLLTKTVEDIPYEDIPYSHGKVIYHWLEVEPEKVRWAGSGGYWFEVSASAVVPVS